MFAGDRGAGSARPCSLPDGALDRAALRALVLADPAALADARSASSIPRSTPSGARLLAAARARGDRIVVSDIPLLFEAVDPAAFDAVVLVDAPEAVRLAPAGRGTAGSTADGGRPDDRGAGARADRSAPAATTSSTTTAISPRCARARGDGVATRSVARALDPPADPPILPRASSTPRSLPWRTFRTICVYTADHEYVGADRRCRASSRIGITDYAQGELGDVVFVNLPKPGDRFAGHQAFGTIEAVKAVSELYSPVAGEVVEVNGALDADPAVVNRDPYGEGWMIRLRVDDPAELDELLTPARTGRTSASDAW